MGSVQVPVPHHAFLRVITAGSPASAEPARPTKCRVSRCAGCSRGTATAGWGARGKWLKLYD